MVETFTAHTDVFGHSESQSSQIYRPSIRQSVTTHHSKKTNPDILLKKQVQYSSFNLHNATPNQGTAIHNQQIQVFPKKQPPRPTYTGIIRNTTPNQGTTSIQPQQPHLFSKPNPTYTGGLRNTAPNQGTVSHQTPQPTSIYHPINNVIHAGHNNERIPVTQPTGLSAFQKMKLNNPSWKNENIFQKGSDIVKLIDENNKKVLSPILNPIINTAGKVSNQSIITTKNQFGLPTLPHTNPLVPTAKGTKWGLESVRDKSFTMMAEYEVGLGVGALFSEGSYLYKTNAVPYANRLISSGSKFKMVAGTGIKSVPISTKTLGYGATALWGSSVLKRSIESKTPVETGFKAIVTEGVPTYYGIKHGSSLANVRINTQVSKKVRESINYKGSFIERPYVQGKGNKALTTGNKYQDKNLMQDFVDAMTKNDKTLTTGKVSGEYRINNLKNQFTSKVDILSGPSPKTKSSSALSSVRTKIKGFKGTSKSHFYIEGSKVNELHYKSQTFNLDTGKVRAGFIATQIKTPYSKISTSLDGKLFQKPEYSLPSIKEPALGLTKKDILISVKTGGGGKREIFDLKHISARTPKIRTPKTKEPIFEKNKYFPLENNLGKYSSEHPFWSAVNKIKGKVTTLLSNKQVKVKVKAPKPTSTSSIKNSKAKPTEYELMKPKADFSALKRKINKINKPIKIKIKKPTVKIKPSKVKEPTGGGSSKYKFKTKSSYQPPPEQDFITPSVSESVTSAVAPKFTSNFRTIIPKLNFGGHTSRVRPTKVEIFKPSSLNKQSFWHKPSTSDIYKPAILNKQSTINKQAEIYKPQLINQQSVWHKTIKDIIPIYTSKSSVISQEQQKQIPKQKTITIPISKSVTTAPEINIPIPPVTGGAGFMLPFGGGSGFSFGKSTKRKTNKFKPKYIPSLTASILNIKRAKIPKFSYESGITIRPIKV